MRIGKNNLFRFGFFLTLRNLMKPNLYLYKSIINSICISNLISYSDVLELDIFNLASTIPCCYIYESFLHRNAFFDFILVHQAYG